MTKHEARELVAKYGIDIIAKSGNFQRFHVPIWRGESLAGAMIQRFKA